MKSRSAPRRRSPRGRFAAAHDRKDRPPFDPYLSEIQHTIRTAPPEAAGGFSVHCRGPHPEFLQPVSEEDVLDHLGSMPSRFLCDLKGVFLLGGSRKQASVALSRLFRYGAYWQGMIFLHPFPRSMMRMRFPRLPKPSIMQDYLRAGAQFEREGDAWLCVFTPQSLRQFYLCDVLTHELGHHVDRHNLHPLRSRKTNGKAERYAEWFAVTHGYARS